MVHEGKGAWEQWEEELAQLTAISELPRDIFVDCGTAFAKSCEMCEAAGSPCNGECISIEGKCQKVRAPPSTPTHVSLVSLPDARNSSSLTEAPAPASFPGTQSQPQCLASHSLNLTTGLVQALSGTLPPYVGTRLQWNVSEHTLWLLSPSPLSALSFSSLLLGANCVPRYKQTLAMVLLDLQSNSS